MNIMQKDMLKDMKNTLKLKEWNSACKFYFFNLIFIYLKQCTAQASQAVWLGHDLLKVRKQNILLFNSFKVSLLGVNTFWVHCMTFLAIILKDLYYVKEN